MPKVDRRLTNDCVYSWVTVTHRDEVQAGDLQSLFSACAEQHPVNTQFMRRITIGCTEAAVVSFFAMENLSPPPGDPYRYPTEMNTKLLQATAVSVFGVSCLFTLCWIRPAEYPKLLGNSKAGFEAVRDVPIIPRDAIDLARPHLDLSYALRRGMRQPSSSPSDRDPLD